MQAGRLDRIEHLLAGSEKNPDGANVREHGDKPAAMPDQQGSQDAASIKRSAAMAEQKNSDTSVSTRQARDHGWRRAISSENLGYIGTFGGAAEAVHELAVHAAPESGVAAGLAAIGVAQILRARAERNAEKKGKA